MTHRVVALLVPLLVSLTVSLLAQNNLCYLEHQLRMGGLCWSKVLLPACPCWQQLVHLD